MSDLMLALHAQSQASEVPWAAVITAVAAVLTTIFTLWFTNRREASRQKAEERRHNAVLRDGREARREQGADERFAQVREERRKAYAELNRLASDFDPNQTTDLKPVLSQIELLTNSKRVLETAEALVEQTTEEHRKAFLAAAKKDLKYKRPTKAQRDFQSLGE